jgi:hypothetical protein
MSKPETSPVTKPPKKDYHPPKLVMYGDFRSVTLACSGGAGGDGGGRFTKQVFCG